MSEIMTGSGAIDGLCAVVPVQNEAATIGNVLRQLYRAGIRQCVVVMNGCVDSTPHVVRDTVKSLFPSYRIVDVFESLGPDVPKAVGTYAALRTFPKLSWLVYVDGDWKGSFGPMLGAYLEERMSSAEHVHWVGHAVSAAGLNDVAVITDADELWQSVLRRRCPVLYQAAPSRAPLLVHQSTFSHISPYWLHHPGRWFSLCALAQCSGFQLGVGTNWDSRLVGNPTRSREHAIRMAETMLGDAVEGCLLLMGHKPNRNWHGRQLDGYHSTRRLDLLKKWQSGL